MSPVHFFAIYLAETSKLFSRLSAKLGLVLVAGASVFAVLFIAWLDGSGIAFTNTETGVTSTLGDSYTFTGADGALAALVPRNMFFIGRLVLVALAAMSVGAEYRRRTLREDLLRPVDRSAVALAKWMSVCTWAAVSLVVTLLFSTALSVPLFGIGGPWHHAALAYASTFIGDCALTAIVLFAAFAVRSVVATIVLGFLFWMLNTAPMWAMWVIQRIANFFMAYDQAATVGAIRVWLPGSAMDTWVEYWMDGVWAWQSFMMLFFMLFGGLLASLLVFRRVDVP